MSSTLTAAMASIATNLLLEGNVSCGSIALVHLLGTNDCNLEAVIQVGNPFVKFVPTGVIDEPGNP